MVFLRRTDADVFVTASSRKSVAEDRLRLALGDVAKRVRLRRVDLVGLAEVPRVIADAVDILEDAEPLGQFHVDLGPRLRVARRLGNRLPEQEVPLAGPGRNEGVRVVRREHVPPLEIVGVGQDDVRELGGLVDELDDGELELQLSSASRPWPPGHGCSSCGSCGRGSSPRPCTGCRTSPARRCPSGYSPRVKSATGKSSWRSSVCGIEAFRPGIRLVVLGDEVRRDDEAVARHAGRPVRADRVDAALPARAHPRPRRAGSACEWRNSCSCRPCERPSPACSRCPPAGAAACARRSRWWRRSRPSPQKSRVTRRICSTGIVQTRDISSTSILARWSLTTWKDGLTRLARHGERAFDRGVGQIRRRRRASPCASFASQMSGFLVASSRR